MKKVVSVMVLSLGFLTANSASAAMWQNFEGGLGGFFSTNSGIVVSQSDDAAFTGTYSMKLNLPDGLSGSWTEIVSWFWADWSATPVMKVHMKAGIDGQGGNNLHFSFWDWNRNGGDWANGGAAVASIAIPNDTNWHTYLLDMSSFNRSSVGGVRFYTNYLGAGNYYIDDLEMVPEPATLSLLALAGLGLLRRKK